MNDFFNLPTHIQFDLALLFISLGICVFAWLMGICIPPFSKSKLNLPPITLYAGTHFPNKIDQVYTMAYLAFFAWQSGHNHYLSAWTETDPADATYNVTMVLWNLLVYMPMLVRYAFLPRWHKPAMGIGRICIVIFSSLFVIYWITACLELSGLFQYLMEKTGAKELQPVLEVLMHGDTQTRICLIVSAVLIAPICEECCFRGFLYNTLKQHCEILTATLATGLLFASVHTALLQFIPLAVFGCVMCIIYEYTRRLWVPIVVHMLFNSVSTIVVLTIGLPL